MKLEALFCLRTQGEDLPADLQGVFSCLDGVLCFVPRESAPKSLPYCYELGEGKNRLLPLLKYLASKETLVALRGIRLCGKPLYPVIACELAEEDDTPSELLGRARKGTTPLWLKTCIESLRAGQIVCPEAPGFESLAEIEAFYSVCRHIFPPWLSKAVSRDLTIAQQRGSMQRNQHAETALKCLLNIDWTKKGVQAPSLDEAKERLDRQLYGMEGIKQKMLDIIARVRRTGDFSAQPPMLISGAPGVGKTTVAKAFAALFDLGVIWLDLSVIGNNPLAIAGSERIFANGTPGLIAAGLLENRSSNVIVIVNEIDKAFGQHTGGWAADESVAAGSAATALLSLLDGQGFSENFLEACLPTDAMLIIATCNDSSKLPETLQSRLSEIQLGGYSVSEKKAIWSGFALPEALKRWRIEAGQILSEDALDLLVMEYAVEPGARDLIKTADMLAAACERRMRETGENAAHIFGKSELRQLLGPPKKRRRESQPGQATAFAYQDGSAYEILVQASAAPGDGAFRVLGDVNMLQREYLAAAYACVLGRVLRERPHLDVTVFLRGDPVPSSGKNLLSFAAFAAILSNLTQVDLGPTTAFIGGIDLAGTLYFDESDIRPLLKALQRSEARTVFAPAGTIEMIDIQAPDLCELCPNLKVIESKNALDLLQLVISEEDLFDLNFC